MTKHRSAVELHNLLGRDLTFYDDHGDIVGDLDTNGRVWVTSDYEPVGEAALPIDPGLDKLALYQGVPLVRAVHERVVGLPDPQPGRLYVVSGLVAALEAHRRTDLVCPAQMVRLAGRVLGPKSLMVR